MPTSVQWIFTNLGGYFFNDIVGVASSPKARFELGDIVIRWFRWGVHRDSTIIMNKKTKKQTPDRR